VNIQLDLIGIALLAVVFANSLLGFLVYFNKKQKDAVSQRYFALALSIDIWVLSMLFFRGVASPDVVDVFSRILYASFTFVPLSFFYFSASFFGKKIGKRRQILVDALFVVSFVVAAVPGLLITGTELRSGQENAIFFGGWSSVLYSVYATLAMGLGYLYLADFYRKAKDKHERLRTLFVIIGTLVASSTGFLTNLLLPFFGVFTFNWMSQITIVIMVIIISIAILRYQLFNVKVLLTQAAVFAIWTISFYQLLASATTTVSTIIGVSSFVITVIVGFQLIRSVKKEVAQRESLEELSGRLKEVNNELQKLDQMKTEFLSLASHQLRTPLTSIKGYASMVLEGSFGKLTKKMHEPVRRIFESSNVLAKIIADLLDVSKIEQGGLQYEMLTFSLASMAQSVVDEQSINAKKRRIKLSLELKQPGRYALKGDQNKLRQVVVNLVDNAIKYTDPDGNVKVRLEKKKKGDQKLIRLSVVDNGRGIEPETIHKLFQKFSRGAAGKKTNMGGSGLGLYLAKQIAKAHAGDLWAESDGPGKGSSFIVEFPQEY
jgi:signal transduction histidine kinase